MSQFLKGKEARETLNRILDMGYKHKSQYKYADGMSGYFKEKLPSGEEIWTAYDSRTNDCWVEEFKTKKECIKWL